MAVQQPSLAPSATPGGKAALIAIVEAQMKDLGNELDRAWKKVPRDIRIKFLREQMKSKEWDGLIADARGKPAETPESEALQRTADQFRKADVLRREEAGLARQGMFESMKQRDRNA